ncbi:MAG: DUF1552 domain-containing protein [Myxococcota bacterium]
MHLIRKIPRRLLLEGAGALALSAPFLGRIRSAHAQDAPVRFFGFMTAHDNLHRDYWHPNVGSGSPLPSSLPGFLSEIDGHLSKTTMISDMENNKSRPGTHEGWGIMLTGRDSRNGNADGPSVDHVIAERHGQTPLVMGHRSRETPTDLRNYCSWAGSGRPNAPIANPADAFEQVFGAGVPDSGPDPAAEARRRQRRSVLDFVAQEIQAVQPRLPAADRAQLDAHLTGIRQLEMQVADITMPTCSVDEVRADGWDPTANENFPRMIRLCNQIAVMATRCDLRRSFILQYGSCSGHFLRPGRWNDGPINDGDNWHDIAHRGEESNRIALEHFMMKIFNDLLDDLDALQEAGGKSHLDNSVCLWMRNMSNTSRSGNAHRQGDRFALLVGGAGGRLPGNQFYDSGGTEDNKVLITLMHACGFDDDTFGDSNLGRGPYPVLA